MITRIFRSPRTPPLAGIGVSFLFAFSAPLLGQGPELKPLPEHIAQLD